MRLGFESAYEDSEVRDEALRAYLPGRRKEEGGKELGFRGGGGRGGGRVGWAGCFMVVSRLAACGASPVSGFRMGLVWGSCFGVVCFVGFV